MPGTADQSIPTVPNINSPPHLRPDPRELAFFEDQPQMPHRQNRKVVEISRGSASKMF